MEEFRCPVCGEISDLPYDDSNWCSNCAEAELLAQEEEDSDREFPELIGYLRSA